MQNTRSRITENIQYYRENNDWHGVIEEMEKLFALSGDPHIRVRIGDARRKLNRRRDAIREYIFAADLFAHEGSLAKALAQYSLVLRLDSSNENARLMRELMTRRLGARDAKPASMGHRAPQPA